MRLEDLWDDINDEMVDNSMKIMWKYFRNKTMMKMIMIKVLKRAEKRSLRDMIKEKSVENSEDK